jgi:hypothetical protein
MYVEDPEMSLNVGRNINLAAEALFSQAESWIVVLSAPAPLDALVPLMKAAGRGVETELFVCPAGLNELATLGCFRELIGSGVAVRRVDELDSHLVLTERAGLLRLSSSPAQPSVATVLDLPVHNAMHAAAMRLIENSLRPRSRMIVEAEAHGTRPPAPPRSGSGYCIQCQGRVPLCAAAPFCRAHYVAWAGRPQPMALMSYCHRCGELNATCFNYPLCIRCTQDRASVMLGARGHPC